MTHYNNDDFIKSLFILNKILLTAPEHSIPPWEFVTALLCFTADVVGKTIISFEAIDLVTDKFKEISTQSFKEHNPL